ncbi:MAG: IclR family transcriptional regulator [Proteobacteria bacterium]|nr:IclR family transcriptional regulator [Pseudomonadota bacterium]
MTARTQRTQRKRAPPSVAERPGKGGARAPRQNGNAPPRATAEDSRNVVNSLSKGLRVLEAFTAERSEMTLSEIARAADIDPGTAFRMLNTLVLLGYVARISESRRFRLTLKVVDLGLHAIGRADLRELARPILRSLVGEISTWILSPSSAGAS